MDTKEKNGKVEKRKETLSNFWQKTSNVGKKAAEGAKTLAEQTKKNIHDAQAKKYTVITEKELASEEFVIPTVIKIEDDLANRNFVACEDAIGWIEKHNNLNVLHIYFEFAQKCSLNFIPMPQINGIYCSYIFDENKFINVNDTFKITIDEKVAELEKTAYELGAKSCSIEIVESDNDSKGTTIGFKAGTSDVSIGIDGGLSKSKRSVVKSKATVSWAGSDIPKMPQLVWFKHNDTIKNLIDMRFSDGNAIKSKRYELCGSSYFTMTQNIATTIDSIAGLKGASSFENKLVKEKNSILIYEIEF